MLSFFRLFKDRDTSAQFNRTWIANIQSTHAAVFAYIEGLIVLSAIQAVFVINQSWVVGAVYLVAFSAQLLLTSIYVRATTLMALGKLNWSARSRSIMLWITGLAGIALNVWLLNALGHVVDELMQPTLTAYN